MAEFGFLGVVVYTRVQTPLLCGQESRAADLLFLVIVTLPFLTNCEIVGINMSIKYQITPFFGAANVMIIRNYSNGWLKKAKQNEKLGKKPTVQRFKTYMTFKNTSRNPRIDILNNN
ncbi:hypothetical protein [Croceitalea dokdonensis]|nr:hypothetical protein [Croceitalea dokdonensis]